MMRRSILSGLLGLGVALLFGALAAQAAPVLWDSGSGGNDHYYEVITSTETWTNARTSAQAQPLPAAGYLTGELASIESAQEQAFIIGLSGFGDGWIGATDDPNITGRSHNEWSWLQANDGSTMAYFFLQGGGLQPPFTYANWNGGEPNGNQNGESAGQIYTAGGWNDLPTTNTQARYVVEWLPVPTDGAVTSAATDYWDLASTWSGAPAPPTNKTVVTVDSHHVGVRAENPPGTPLTNVGYSLDIINGGQVDIGDSATLTITAGMNSAPGTQVTLANGSTLAVGGGGTLASVTTSGHATINSGATLTVTNFDGPNGNTFTKAGAGVLALRNVANGNGTFELAGGTLQLEASTYLANGLRGSIFLGTPDNNTPLDLSGAGYAYSPSRVFTGTKGGTVLARAEAPGLNVVALGDVTGYGMFPGFTPPDHFVTAFSGQFIPQATGSYNFRWDCDDRGMMYIDVNNDGTFDASEGVVGAPAWGANGNVNLTASQPYKFIFMAQEYGGGESVNFWYTPPGGPEARVNATAQTGMWQYLKSGALNMPTTNFNVTANSALRTVAEDGSTFGDLRLDDSTLSGRTLTTQGGPMTFNSIAIAGPAGRKGTLAAENKVTTANYADGGVATTFVKAAGGTLTLDNSASGISAPATTFEVAGGVLAGAGATPLGGSTHLVLSGGTARFSDALAPPAGAPAGALGAWNFDASNANDSSGNLYHGTAVGSVAYSSDTGIGTGQSLNLTAGNAYVTVSTGGTEDVFDGGGAMTIAAWVKGWPGTWNPFVSKHGEPNGWQMRRHGGDPTVDWTTRGVGANNGDFPSASGAVSDGQWHQITMSYDGSAKRIYIDGVLNATEVAGGTITGSNEMLTFGARNTGPGNFGNFFSGLLDDIYFYNRALSAAEIAQLLPSGTAPDMSATNVLVTADSGLDLRSTSSIAFADLTLQNGVLRTMGTSPGISFAGTTVTGGGTVGFDTQIPTRPGPIDGGGQAATILKRGASDLILDQQGINLDNATFRLEAGRLIGANASNPFGAARLETAGGELVLSSTGPNPADFDNSLHVAGNSTLRAGRSGVVAGEISGVAVRLGSSGRDVSIDGGATLTVRTSDGYGLEFLGQVGGGGTMDVQNSITLAQGANGLGTLRITSGQVTTPQPLNVGALDLVGGTLNRTGGGANADVTVTNRLMLTSDSLDMTGSTLTSAGAAITVGPSRTLTVTNPLNAAGVLVQNGGSMNALGGGTVGGLTLQGGTANTPGLTITGQMAAGTAKVTAAGGSFGVSGADLLNPSPAQHSKLTLTGSPVNVRVGGMPDGLRLWLDASDAGTLYQDTGGANPVTGDGQLVARWNDKSVSGIVTSEGNAGDQPTYVAAAASLNNKPALFFEGGGGGDVLRSTTGNSTGVSGNGDCTVITVWADATGTGQNYQHTFHMGDTNYRQAYGHSVSRGGNQGQIGNHYWGDGFDATATGGLGAANIAVSTWDGTLDRDSWYVNGQFVNARDLGGPLNIGTGQLMIGSRLAPIDEGFRGNLAEVLVFDSVLSAAQLNNVGGYLAAKYGLGTSYTGSIQPEPINLPYTDIKVDSATTLTLDTTGAVTLGDLTLNLGEVLTIDTDASSIFFSSLNILGDPLDPGESALLMNSSMGGLFTPVMFGQVLFNGGPLTGMGLMYGDTLVLTTGDIPEPLTLGLVAMGLAGLGAYWRKRRRIG